MTAPGRRKPPIPLTVVTGFLGAGKTTLLNRLLRDPALAGTAVIVNEFGEVGLDHLLVGKAEEGIVELSSGCLCCTIRGELVATLEGLLRAVDNHRIERLDRVVIETTGLADPAPVLQSVLLHPYLSIRYRLDGVVTLVDAVNGMATLDRQDEAVRQAAVADRIVLTKTDLPGADPALPARLRRLNPVAPILDAAKGEAEPLRLLDNQPFATEGKIPDVALWLAEKGGDDHHDDDHGHHHLHHHDVNRHDARISTLSAVREAPVGRAAFEAFLEQLAGTLGPDLLRVKGIVRLAEDPERPLVVQGVQTVFHPPQILPAWPDADRRSRLVVIARDLEGSAAARLLAAFEGLPRADTAELSALSDNPLAISGFSGFRR